MKEKFFWGAATSAHQVEGGNTNDWAEWEKKNAKRLAGRAKKNPPAGGWPSYLTAHGADPLLEANYISGKACDHYNRFREDFDIAKSLGHNAHRFSIEWSRIEPEEGKFNEKEIEHYREVIRALRERRLEPLVTLWHWTLPVWLAEKGGIVSSRFPGHFARYAKYVAERLGKDITFWVTLNEPEIYSLNSYLRGIWPPQKHSIYLFYKAIARLIKAHREARKEIKQVSPEAKIGIAANLTFFESAGGPVNDFLKWLADRLWNYHFLNHVRGKLDFIGLNYYSHSRINYAFNKNENKDTSDMNWEIFPEGIYKVLANLKKYNKPIYITENGVADARDALRAKFIKDHITWIKKAIGEGVDVRGYLYWSLLDNFEWDKGFWPRFGLVEIDYKTMERKIRPSALEYKKIIDSWFQ